MCISDSTWAIKPLYGRLPAHVHDRHYRLDGAVFRGVIDWRGQCVPIDPSLAARNSFRPRLSVRSTGHRLEKRSIRKIIIRRSYCDWYMSTQRGQIETGNLPHHTKHMLATDVSLFGRLRTFSASLPTGAQSPTTPSSQLSAWPFSRIKLDVLESTLLFCCPRKLPANGLHLHQYV